MEERKEGGKEGGGDTLAGKVELSHPPSLHSPIHPLTHAKSGKMFVRASNIITSCHSMLITESLACFKWST